MGSCVMIVRLWILIGEAMSFMIVFNLNVYENKFIKTIEATKRYPHQGDNRKYMEVEGPCHELPDHCSHVS